MCCLRELGRCATKNWWSFHLELVTNIRYWSQLALLENRIEWQAAGMQFIWYDVWKLPTAFNPQQVAYYAHNKMFVVTSFFIGSFQCMWTSTAHWRLMWRDWWQGRVSLPAIKFEEACVLFNAAALHARLGERYGKPTTNLRIKMTQMIDTKQIQRSMQILISIHVIL